MLSPSHPYYGQRTTYSEANRIGSIDQEAILHTLAHVIPLLNDPMPQMSGFGIVTVAGGSYLRYLWVLSKKVREVSDAPILCYHIGPEEIEHPSVPLLKDLGVEFVDAWPMMRAENYQSRHGWCAKSIAVKYSPFQTVCFLDADCFPRIDPESILTHEDFSTGFLAFEDIQHCRTNDMLFPNLGLMYIPDWKEAEAGQFLVDKARYWKEIQLYSWMNGRPKPFHDLAHGDKVLLQLSCMKFGRAFKMGGTPHYDGSAIHHFLSDGTPAFYHLGNHKRGVATTPEVQALLNEFEQITNLTHV